MPLDYFLSRSVTILTPGTVTDRYHDQIVDWSTATKANAKAWIAQTTTSENQDHRDAAIETLEATLAPEAQITARSRVIVDGVTYEVVGTPKIAHTPRGPHHIEVSLQACTG